MAAGVFRIQEVPVGGVEGDGEVFVWVADKTMPSASAGGARAAPVGIWEMAGKLRTVRSDPPGAILPSEQVLGPVHEPFEWSGSWNDKYNFPGYATKERDRFEGMCRRGNFVKISFKDESFSALITSWKFAYRTDWDIGYSFSVSTHSKVGQEKFDRPPSAGENPVAAVDNVSIYLGQAAKVSAKKPAWAVKTPAVSEVSEALAVVSQRIDTISKSLDTRTGVLKPISDSKNLALQFRALQGDCQGVVLKLVAARSDLDMGVRTGIDVLRFDEWARSTSRLMRMAAGRSRSAADGLDKMDKASTLTIYRPFKGESLHSIARKAYGTSNAWRVIYEHNRLTYVIMLGTEALEIPVKGRS